jgi:hypothetical protein
MISIICWVCIYSAGSSSGCISVVGSSVVDSVKSLKSIG